MYQTIDEPVTIVTRYDHRTHKTLPIQMNWRNRNHPIQQIGFYHTYKNGSDLFHIFEGVATGFYFRLKLNAQTLQWTLEKVDS